MTKTLEQKAKKIDWKEWLPIYGIYQIYKDSKEGKPSVLGNPNLNYFGSSVYHAFSTFAIGTGLSELAEKFL